MKAASIGPASRRLFLPLREQELFLADSSLDTSIDSEGAVFPPTAQMLTEGGDARISCDSIGSNRYGCSCEPEADVLAYGSSTASTISTAGFRAADALKKRLEQAARREAPAITYQRELDRIRRHLINLCDLHELPGLELIFGASGTDLHLFASQLMVETGSPAPLIIRVEAAETGRGVPDALAGRHFGDCAALGDVVVPQVPLDCGRPIEILEVKCRKENGAPRPPAEVDAEVEEAVLRAAPTGQRILLTLVDVSKTGLLAPSPSCVDALRQRFPGQVEVLVDACQFRLAPPTLRAYLERDFLVAVTGSKFVTGPTFCGAIFVPESAASRLRHRALPHALKSYSAQADWPGNWAARTHLKPVANYGLLLRWEAALEEFRAFRSLSDGAIRDFLREFGKAVTSHLAADPSFEYLPAPLLSRAPLSSNSGWDHLPTIFSFLLRREEPSGHSVWLDLNATRRVHECLRQDLGRLSQAPAPSLLSLRCQIGQPVACGVRDGQPVHALRLCLSSRLIVDALSPDGRGKEAVIAEALGVLDKAALLAARPAL
jgi:hypothetical protein